MPAVNIFSFGVEAVPASSTGRRPVPRPHVRRRAPRHRGHRSPRRRCPSDVAQCSFAPIVDKALEKDPPDTATRRCATWWSISAGSHGKGRSPRRGISRHRRWRIVAAGAAVVILISLVSWSVFRRGHGASATPVRSLAVLPLKPLAQGGGDADIGLGLADTIITRIGRIEGIAVRPTSAVRRYSAPDANALEAARELQVDAVLDGTLQRAGDRLRVNMTLVRVSDGATLWSRTFNTAFAHVFAIEDEIATGVVSELRASLSQTERMRLTKHHTSSPEAYEYYLKGVATFSSVGSASANVTGNVDAGIKLLERTVAIDPNYALAHAQLAWAPCGWPASMPTT